MNVRPVRIACAALLLAPAPLAAQAAPPAAPAGLVHYAIDTVHSSVSFKVRHLGVSWVSGDFHSFSGAFDFDSANVERSSVTARIATASVSTSADRRDNDLRQNYLQADSFPEMTFTSRRVERVDATHFRVIGDLSLHGVTRPVTLATELSGTNVIHRQTPDGRTTMRRLAAFTATATISRSEFGITINRLVDAIAVVGDEVRITIEIEAGAVVGAPSP